MFDSEIQRRSFFHFDSDYPNRLKRLEDPPKVIDFIGSSTCLERPTLGIVGTRNPSLQSLSLVSHWISSLSHLPQMKDLLVLSGGARGIDEAAHQAAMKSGLTTLIVAPSGLECMYPSFWQQHLDAKNPLVAALSEYEASTKMRPWFFEARNRLIAALSDVLLVIEARVRSGTAITARHALNLSGTVAAVPWHPLDHRGELNHRLIRDGAFPVHDAEDVAQLLSSQCQHVIRRTSCVGRSRSLRLQE